MKPHIIRLGRTSGTSRSDADALADLHTRSRQVAYRDLYGDAYLDHELLGVSRASWRAARFEDFDPACDLILAAIEDGAPIGPPPIGLAPIGLAPIGLAPIGLAFASFRLKPEVGALLDNLHVAPERKGGGLGTRLLAEAARWLVEDHAGAPLHLEVYGPNAAALGFYERLGGVEAARYAEAVPGGRVVEVVRYRCGRPPRTCSAGRIPIRKRRAPVSGSLAGSPPWRLSVFGSRPPYGLLHAFPPIRGLLERSRPASL
ncbi:GNAT family N-acetyltransferase [Caulobacter segnis]